MSDNFMLKYVNFISPNYMLIVNCYVRLMSGWHCVLLRVWRVCRTVLSFTVSTQTSVVSLCRVVELTVTGISLSPPPPAAAAVAVAVCCVLSTSSRDQLLSIALHCSRIRLLYRCVVTHVSDCYTGVLSLTCVIIQSINQTECFEWPK